MNMNILNSMNQNHNHFSNNNQNHFQGNSNFISGVDKNNKAYIIIDNNEENYDKETNINNGIDFDEKEKNEYNSSNNFESPGFHSKKKMVYNMPNMQLNMSEKENNLSGNFIKNKNDSHKFSFGNFNNMINPLKKSYVKIHKDSCNMSNRLNNINESKMGSSTRNNFRKGKLSIFYLYFRYNK